MLGVVELSPKTTLDVDVLNDDDDVDDDDEGDESRTK
jgi:hypothetical protein